jgi:hypothetical protein
MPSTNIEHRHNAALDEQAHHVALDGGLALAQHLGYAAVAPPARKHLRKKVDQPPLIQKQQKDVDGNERSHYQQPRHRCERAAQQASGPAASLIHVA